MADIIFIIFIILIFVGSIWLAMSNARRASIVGKDPTFWGLLSFLFFPVGAIIIRLYLLKMRRPV